jgi:O-methyltransferase involved in polyketide biosynthesis
LIAADLRDHDGLKTKFEALNIDYSLPTLVFAECVLIYLPTKMSNEVLKYFADSFQNVHFLNWEMMKLNDKFGQVMIRNFEV